MKAIDERWAMEDHEQVQIYVGDVSVTLRTRNGHCEVVQVSRPETDAGEGVRGLSVVRCSNGVISEREEFKGTMTFRPVTVEAAEAVA